MSHTKQIANRFREVILNGKWIAFTNFKEQISDLTWEQATLKIGSLNTVAALTFHINYYTAGLVQVLEGGGLEIRDKHSFDLPPIESEADWQKLVTTLLTNAERYAELIEKMPDPQLWEPFVEEKYGKYYRNIEGMIEHAYYHLGQVVLLKKMILEK